MSAEIYGITSLAALVLLLALRIPIAVALGSVAMIGLYLVLGFDPMIGAAGNLTFDFVASWELSAIPLFIFMGAISSRSGLVASLYEVARIWLARIPGGLAVATLLAFVVGLASIHWLIRYLSRHSTGLFVGYRVLLGGLLLGLLAAGTISAT